MFLYRYLATEPPTTTAPPTTMTSAPPTTTGVPATTTAIPGNKSAKLMSANNKLKVGGHRRRTLRKDIG